MRLVLDETLPVELENKNDGQGHSWHRTAAARKKFKQALSPKYIRTPFTFPVGVSVTRILGPRQRLWDSSSILRGNYKQLEDTLVELGWFNDDGPEWIKGTFGFQDDSRRDEGPAVQIHILRVD